MKCCSLNRKVLERHYKKMVAKYYSLGGNNNPPLKQVIMAFLSDELQPELQWMMMALRKEVATTTIGEIYQLALAALDKLCEQQQMFKQLNKNSGKLKGACNKSYLKIKCKESSTCDSSIEDEEDLESVLEEQERKDRETEYVFQDSDSEEDLPPRRSIFSISSIASITTRIPKGSSFPEEEEELGYLGSLGLKQIDGTPRPHFDLKVKTSVYDKPTKAVALMDTGSCATVLRPHVLPKEMWAPFSKRLNYLTQGIQSILEIQEAPEEYKEIQQLLLSVCCDSHDQFNHPAPLWKNPEFYVRLSFKKNEDVNPTKATHSGMNPEDLKLARAECAALLVQGLIEPTNSN
ncbi:polyprotein [Arachis hypogaea]|nr:polyprotein [Arachis hypogaea]